MEIIEIQKEPQELLGVARTRVRVVRPPLLDLPNSCGDMLIVADLNGAVEAQEKQKMKAGLAGFFGNYHISGKGREMIKWE